MTESAPTNRPATFHPLGYVKNGRWYFANIAAVSAGRIFWFICNGAFAVAAGVTLGIYLNWIIGLFAFAFIVGINWKIRRRYGLWRGDCPYCAQSIGIAHGSGGVHAFDCPVCTRRLFLTGGEFRAV